MTLKGLRNWTARAALGLLCGRVGRLGPRGRERAARLFARLLWRFQETRRGVMLRRMREVLDPALSDEELLRIQHDAYLNMGRMVAEFLQLASMGPEQVARSLRLDGTEHIERALAAGKGIIFLTAHFGNWELLAARLAHFCRQNSFHVIAQTQRDRGLTQLVDSVRLRQGMRVIARDGAAREVIRTLRQGNLIGILMDIDAKDDGIVVDFLGKPASTTTAPVAYALRTGATILPAFDYRLPDGTHVAQIGPPVDLVVTGERERDLRENTILLNSVLERHIRARPDLWVWVPDRWRSVDPTSAPG